MAISNAVGAGWSLGACDPVNRLGAPSGAAAEQDARVTARIRRPPLRLAPAQPPDDPSLLADLIARMARRDESALCALYDATVAKVYGVAVRILRVAAAAEEVVVDTFHQAWREAARFDLARGAPLAWLLTICRSRALDARRAADRAVAHEDPDSLRRADGHDVEDDPLDLLAALETRAALHAALTRLAPAQRQMLGLAFFRGYTHEEIAAHAALPLGTVKSQIRRALTALRRELAQCRGDER
jgi:RNA polymerase sigma-70 factor (ECF subfamily)